MSSRMKSNGTYTPPDASNVRTSRESPRSYFESSKTSAGQPIIQKFADVVKNRPGVTLLVALAAGLALGILVKRK